MSAYRLIYFVPSASFLINFVTSAYLLIYFVSSRNMSASLCFVTCASLQVHMVASLLLGRFGAAGKHSVLYSSCSCEVRYPIPAGAISPLSGSISAVSNSFQSLFSPSGSTSAVSNSFRSLFSPWKVKSVLLYLNLVLVGAWCEFLFAKPARGRRRNPHAMKLKKKQEQEKLIKPIPNELDYAEELDKAPSIPVKENNGRAIETIEEAKGIFSSSTDGAQQHHQESEFGEDTYSRFELIGNYIELRDRIRLRVVCRLWNEIFSLKEVYGMFVQTGNLISFLSLKNKFSIFPGPLHFEGGDIVLVSSCQGILCFRTTSGYIVGNHHNEYRALPAQIINHGKKKVVAILCHELGDGNFKLAIAFATESLNLAFEVYAEGKWFTIESSIKGPHLLYLRRDGLYHNGSAYFLSEWGCIYKFDLATRASFLLLGNALRSDILGVFQNRVCTFRFDRVEAGCELVVASVKENVVQCSLKLDWARLKLSPSGCRILTCTKDHNIIIAIGMKIFWYKIHSGVLEPIGSLPEDDKANFVAYSCYDVNEILNF